MKDCVYSEKPYSSYGEMNEDIKELINNLKYWSNKRFENHFTEKIESEEKK